VVGGVGDIDVAFRGAGRVIDRDAGVAIELTVPVAGGAEGGFEDVGLRRHRGGGGKQKGEKPLGSMRGAPWPCGHRQWAHHSLGRGGGRHGPARGSRSMETASVRGARCNSPSCLSVRGGGCVGKIGLACHATDPTGKGKRARTTALSQGWECAGIEGATLTTIQSPAGRGSGYTRRPEGKVGRSGDEGARERRAHKAGDPPPAVGETVPISDPCERQCSMSPAPRSAFLIPAAP